MKEYKYNSIWDLVKFLGKWLAIITTFFLYCWGVYKLGHIFDTEPDTRTIEQIQQDNYKNCVKSASPISVETCKNYLK